MQGATFIPRLSGVTPRAFIAGIAHQLGEESTKAVSEIYGITPDMDQTLFLTPALRWVGDAIFDGNQIPQITAFSVTDHFRSRPRVGEVLVHTY